MRTTSGFLCLGGKRRHRLITDDTNLPIADHTHPFDIATMEEIPLMVPASSFLLCQLERALNLRRATYSTN